MIVNKVSIRIRPPKNHLVKILFMTGIFILPFVAWYRYKVPFEVPRVVFFQAWVAILAILSLVFGENALKHLKIDKILLLLLISFLFTVFTTSYLGVDFTKSIWGNFFRSDGIITLTHLLAFSLLVGIVWQRSWEKDLKTVIAVSSALISLWSIFNLGPGVGVSFGNPNFLAGYLLITLPFTLSISKVLSLVQVAAILATGAFFPTVAAFLFLALVFVVKRKKRVLVYGLTLIVFIIIATIAKTEIARSRLQDGYIAENRVRIFIKGILAFTERPMTGWGWANFDYAFDSISWPIKFESDRYIDKAHSTFLEILVTSGVIGFSLYLLIIARTFTLLAKKGYENPFLQSFGLFIIHAQTNIISINEEIIFWLIVGIAINGYFLKASKCSES